MHAGPSSILLLPVLFAACGHHERAALHGGAALDPLAFDGVQRTCALYVAVRSTAWEKPMTFGNEPYDSALHWNMCPVGNMVACAVATTTGGDSTLTGIPWPYGP